MTITGIRGICPIGAVIAWIKSFTGVPALATQGRDEWVECNGQAISDVESPLNGQTIPNLNASGGGTKRFLRGSTTSGTTGGTDTHTHSIQSGSILVSGEGSYDSCSTGSAGTLPSYYEIVWILRTR
jgi:hypothetical protein